jgi:hypothetical protein
LGVRWSSHRFGQFIDPIVKVRAILAKLLKQRDPLGDLLFAQGRQLQFAALGKATVSALRGDLPLCGTVKTSAGEAATFK